jgi:hypothetical protein
MPKTNIRTEKKPKAKGVMIYLSDDEIAMLKGDLERENGHRVKKFSMSELLRRKVFDSKTRVKEIVRTNPQPLPDFEKIISDCLTKTRPQENFLESQLSGFVSILEQIIKEQGRLCVANIELAREEILDLKGD